jgi:hypothetical protein
MSKQSDIVISLAVGRWLRRVGCARSSAAFDQRRNWGYTPSDVASRSDRVRSGSAGAELLTVGQRRPKAAGQPVSSSARGRPDEFALVLEFRDLHDVT